MKLRKGFSDLFTFNLLLFTLNRYFWNRLRKGSIVALIQLIIIIQTYGTRRTKAKFVAR